MDILNSILLFVIGVSIGASLSIFKYISISKDNAIKDQKIKDLLESTSEYSKLSCSLKGEFESIASKILDENKSKIAGFSRDSFESVIMPFKVKIDEFRSKIEAFQIYEAEKMSGLQNELGKLITLNKQISDEANNLASALKGDNKFQGMWGELSIERIFEYVGMIRGVNYLSQKQFKGDEENKIPDYIIILPEEKHIAIDAKTSLSAYERYYNSRSETEKKIYLKEHSVSIKKHIDELALKDYTTLTGLNQPEYVLMFVPIEGAVSVALIDKPDIVAYAFKKNIVLVTPSTLLATLKTVEYIWRQENQKKNVFEIAKHGGNLYDKFVVFVQTLIEADRKIYEARNKTQEAIKRLSFSDKRGDSLIERAQKLKDLGAHAKKEIPKELLKDTN
ncbi:MAG: DNA recombination protein RmuC [Endomicrobium sp.]|jgi:DNA recombination protein RmuC|nr:DNA recombination protein RmuC [Endomicrobium sp.]